MEIRVGVTGDERGAAELHGLLADTPEAPWTAELSPDGTEVRIRLDNSGALDTLTAVVRGWEAAQGNSVQVTLRGPGGVAGLDDDLSEPSVFGDVHWISGHGNVGIDKRDGSTPPGPVLDPGDDWTRD